MAAPAGDAFIFALCRLGIRPYEARALAALEVLGEANSTELAEQSGVPRTSLYGAFEDLVARNLAVRVDKPGTARWAAIGRPAIASALIAETQAQADLILRTLTSGAQPARG